MKATVIIPTFNEQEYLIPCIDALLKQSVPIHQIIVVDNNSSDDSVDKAKARFPEIEYLFEAEQGIVFARNAGFAAATGDVLIKIDADTIVSPDWHRAILDDFKVYGCDGWSGYVDSSDVRPWMLPIVRGVFNFFVFPVNNVVIGSGMLFGCNLAVSRKAWDTIKGELHMANNIWEDVDIAVLLQKHDFKVFQNKKALVQISARSANTNPVRFYKRSYGLTRALALHKKWFSVALSILVVNAGFVSWLALQPISLLGRAVSKRPRPEQY